MNTWTQKKFYSQVIQNSDVIPARVKSETVVINMCGLLIVPTACITCVQ